MRNIECPTPAYNRLMDSGLVKIILKHRREVEDLFISHYPFSEGKGRKILKEAHNFLFDWSNLISEKWFLFKDIASFNDEIENEDYFAMLEPLFIKYPSFIAHLILGEDVFNYEKYGFPNRRALEESIASFCVGEIHFNERCYYWRNGDLKNEISSNIHGDFYASQKDVSGKEINTNEENLFGVQVNVNFDTIKENVKINSISAYQDWSRFLWSLLKYADYLGKQNIYEIVHWRDVLKETGFMGTNTAEAYGGSMYYPDFYFDLPILSKDSALEMFPLVVGENSFPYVEDNKLIYLRKNDDGDFSVNTNTKLDDMKFTRGIQYFENDLPPALKATYMFFARDRSILTRIMDCFLSK